MGKYKENSDCIIYIVIYKIIKYQETGTKLHLLKKEQQKYSCFHVLFSFPAVIRISADYRTVTRGSKVAAKRCSALEVLIL